MEDYYKVLGLKRGASLKEISAAYRAQALIYHPDKRKSVNNPVDSAEDDEKFHKIKTAYQALQDPKIRAELDLQLIGQEERLKREAQMSAQRKQMRDELLSREKEAMNPVKKRPVQTEEQDDSVTVRKTKKKVAVSNEDACLTLKCENLVKLQEMDTSFVAEFKDPQEAYKTLCKLPNDMIIKADWFTGYPPDNLNLNIEKVVKTEETIVTTSKEVKYSKEFENSILEKLKRKKLENKN